MSKKHLVDWGDITVDTPKKKYRHPLELPQRLLDNCKVFTSRYAVLDELQLPTSPPVTCEIGVLRGEYSAAMMDKLSPAEHHMVDISARNFSEDFKTRLKEDERMTFYRGRGHKVIQKFPDSFFDFVYVDANHTYQAVHNELRAVTPKLKEGGIIGCNDYISRAYDRKGRKYGVVEAVNEFCIEQDYEIVYFAFNSQMFCDVGLRKVVS